MRFKQHFERNWTMYGSVFGCMLALSTIGFAMMGGRTPVIVDSTWIDHPLEKWEFGLVVIGLTLWFYCLGAEHQLEKTRKYEPWQPSPELIAWVVCTGAAMALVAVMFPTVIGAVAIAVIVGICINVLVAFGVPYSLVAIVGMAVPFVLFVCILRLSLFMLVRKTARRTG